MSQGVMQEEFEFTLVIGNIGEITSEVEDKLFEAGCDDATISKQFGVVLITFSRRAESFENAVVSAVKDVWNADVDAKIIRVDECDLVTQADIARRINRTRQQVHMLTTNERGPGNFPTPVCNITDEKSSNLWYWCEVAQWLFNNNLIKEEDLVHAQTLAIINAILELAYKRGLATQEANRLMEEFCLYVKEDCKQDREPVS